MDDTKKKRGRPSISRTKNAVSFDDLTARWRAIVRLILRGQSNSEIAEQLKISTQTVSNARNSELVKAQLKITQKKIDKNVTEELIERITTTAPKALDVVERYVLGEDSQGQRPDELEQMAPQYKVRYAMELLKVVGVQPKENRTGQALVFNNSTITLLNERAKRMLPMAEDIEEGELI